MFIFVIHLWGLSFAGVKLAILKVGSARKCRHIFYRRICANGGVLFKLRNYIEPEERRHVHQQRVSQQEFEWLGLRGTDIFPFVGIGIRIIGESHLQKLGHQKHKCNNAANNVSVVVHDLIVGFAKVYTNQYETFCTFYEFYKKLIPPQLNAMFATHATLQHASSSE